MTNQHNVSEPPPFDEELAASYVGKYILIGITDEDHEGNVVGQRQLHGVITSATRSGINVALRGVYDGETWNMPPDLRSIRPAEPGTFTLRSTNEDIEDPDLVVTWVRTAPAPDGPK